MKKPLLILLCAMLFAATGCAPKPKPKMTMIEVFSSTCEACIKVKPVIDKIEAKFSAELTVVRYDLNTPDGVEKAKPYQSPQIPVFVFFDRDGRQFFRHVGEADEELLTGIIKSHL
jgi:thioredoxin 1